MEKHSASKTASSLAGRMQVVDPVDVLGDPSRYNFDLDDIKTILGQLAPERCIIQQVYQNITGDLQEEPIYGTKFKSENLSEDLLSVWRNDIAVWGLELNMPKANQYLPSNFVIFPSTYEPSQKSPELIPVVQLPPSVRLWHLQDTDFTTPKANVMVRIHSNIVYSSPINYTLTQVLVEIVNNNLQEVFYSAQLGGLRLSLSPIHSGLQLDISGFNDKMQLLIETVADVLSNPGISTQVFDLAMHNIRLQQEATIQPYKAALLAKDTLLTDPQYSSEDILTALNLISINNIELYAKELVKEIAVEILVVGNVAQSTAIEWAVLLHSISKTSLPWGECLHTSMVQLPQVNTLYQEYNFNDNDANSATMNIYDVGDVNLDIKKKALLGLVGMMIHEPCFNQLRTVEQLGYIVFCFSYEKSNIGYVSAIVQSSSRDAAYLDERVESFWEIYYNDILQSMKPSEFVDLKEALQNKILTKPLSLRELATSMWAVIETGSNSSNEEVDFDIKSKLVSILDEIEIKDVLSFFNSYILSTDANSSSSSISSGENNRRKLAVEIFAQNVVGEEGGGAAIISPSGGATADIRLNETSSEHWKAQQERYSSTLG